MPEQRVKIIVLKKQGLSYQQIADKVKVSKKTVFLTVKRAAELGSIADRLCSGRCQKTTRREDRALVRASLASHFSTASDLASFMKQQHGVVLATRKVRKRLQDAGLNGRTAAKKPFLRPENI